MKTPVEGGEDSKKIDWANVVIAGAPVPKGFGEIGKEITKDLFAAAVDFTDGKFQFAGSKDKPLDEATIELVANSISTVVIAKYDAQIKDAFKNTDPKYTKGMIESINKVATEYTKEIISNGIVDKYTESKKTKISDKK